jgi:glycosyltransferase involved in cell wall biosynthesis
LQSRITVLCVGPGRTVRGGITSVIERIGSRFPGRIRFRTVATFSQYSGSDQPERKGRIVQIFVFLVAFVRICFTGLFSRGTVFHVHLSVKGSTLRKGLVCVALRALRCCYVVHAHAADDSMFHAWVPASLRRVLLWGIGGADYFIALTRFWGEYYANAIQIPANRLLLLPNPAVIPPVVPDRTNREGLHFLFVGRIGKRKGAFELIRAFASLPLEIRVRVRITLAGDGEVDAACELANALGCSAQTSVLGWVEPRETERLLEEADVFFLPSHGEGMSMALLEAMAWGLPVVTTTSGGTDEFLLSDHNCILTKPGDVQEIAGAMCALARDPQLRARLGTEARRTASRFDVDKYIAKLTCLYEELATSPGESTRTQEVFTAKS